jgi:RNA polymerase subunit RPABC4/transcription elongation factor Spt4
MHPIDDMIQICPYCESPRLHPDAGRTTCQQCGHRQAAEDAERCPVCDSNAITTLGSHKVFGDAYCMYRCIPCGTTWYE